MGNQRHPPVHRLSPSTSLLGPSSQFSAWGVNGTSQYVNSLDNYDAKGDGIWFSFEKADSIDSLPVVDGDQVAIK